MKSLVFVQERALATRNAQASVASVWVWTKKTLLQWDGAIAALSQKIGDEAAARATWQVKLGELQTALAQVVTLCRDVVRVGRTQFAVGTGEARLFAHLRVKGNSRIRTARECRAVHKAWEAADAAWVPLPGLSAGALGSSLANVEALESASNGLLAQWRKAAAVLMSSAAALDAECMAWYAVACTRFPESTPEGQMIRATVPTTTTPTQSVGQTVIRNLIASGGTVHFDCSAPHATRYTYLQQAPGEEVFSVIAADVTDSSVTLTDQAPGEHRFKAFGSNAHGSGDESTVAVITVAQQAAA